MATCADRPAQPVLGDVRPHVGCPTVPWGCTVGVCRGSDPEGSPMTFRPTYNGSYQEQHQLREGAGMDTYWHDITGRDQHLIFGFPTHPEQYELRPSIDFERNTHSLGYIDSND